MSDDKFEKALTLEDLENEKTSGQVTDLSEESNGAEEAEVKDGGSRKHKTTPTPKRMKQVVKPNTYSEQIAQLIEEKQEDLHNSKTLLKKAIREKAALQTNLDGLMKPIREEGLRKVKERIETLMELIEDLPHQILVLQDQLKEAQQRESEVVDLIEDQKKMTVTLRNLSKKLFDKLTDTIKTNEVFKKAYREYLALYRKTNVDPLRGEQGFARPSEGALELLLQVMESERNGEPYRPRRFGQFAI